MKALSSGRGMAAMAAMGLLAFASAAPAGAGEPTHTMAALEDRLTPGTEIDVVDREGRVVRGEFVSAGAEGMLLTVFGAVEGRRVAAGDVVTVTRKGDSLKNGALIGAAVGAFSAILVGTDDSGASGCYTTGCKVGTGVAVTALYTGVGMLIDRAMKGREVVYRARADRKTWSMAPYPVPRGGGVRLALRF